MNRPEQIWFSLRRSCWLACRDFAGFLLHPSLAEDRDATKISRRALFLWLLILSFAVTAFFALVALPLIIGTGATTGDTLDRAFDQPALSMILAVVILGPLVEEMIFRGWLTGTIRAVAGTALFLVIWFCGLWLLRMAMPDGVALGWKIVVAILGFGAFLTINRSAESRCAGWYPAAFPFLFWAQGLVFGGLHVANIDSKSAVLPILMSLPLVLCGWIWGYARLRLGLATAWLLHMAYNIPASIAIIVGMTLG